MPKCQQNSSLKMCFLSALTNNCTVSMRLIAIGRAFYNRGPTTLNERSPKLTSFVRGTDNMIVLLRRTCAACGALSLQHVGKIQQCRAVGASKYVQKYFKFDAMFDRKPVQLLQRA